MCDYLVQGDIKVEWTYNVVVELSSLDVSTIGHKSLVVTPQACYSSCRCKSTASWWKSEFLRSDGAIEAAVSSYGASSGKTLQQCILGLPEAPDRPYILHRNS